MKTENTFRAEAYGEDEVLFLGPPGIGAYLYSLEEIAEKFPTQTEDPAANEVIRILNFLLEQGRLGIEQPTMEELADAFEIEARGINDEEGTIVQFGDPNAFPTEQRFGCQFTMEQLTQFGKGDSGKGIARVKTYLRAYYQEHGSIKGAVTTQPKKGSQGEVETSFKMILAWEKAKRAEKRAAKAQKP